MVRRVGRDAQLLRSAQAGLRADALTPGGVGVNQALNAATASAYSIGQQLLTTVWNVVLAAVLVAAAFARSGGKRLVEESSAQARELQAERRA